MKAILLLAVFALACQAHLDVAEFYRGVISNMPMETEAKNIIMNNGLDCVNWSFHATAAYAQTMLEHIQEKNIIALLKDYESAKQLLENTVGPKCAVVAQQLAIFFGQYAATHPKPNFNGLDYPFYQSNIIQLAGKALQQLAMGQTFEAGNEVGAIIRIISGMEKPTIPKTPEFSFEKWVRYDEQKFITEFAAGLSKSLAIHDETVAVAATKTMLELIQVLNDAQNAPAFHTNNALFKIQGIVEIVTKISDIIHRCPVHKEIFRSIGPVFKAYPGLATLHVFSNIVLENPTIVANYMSVIIYSMQGEYQLAGETLGAELKVLFKGF
jgi:hypothetical protein